MAPPQPRFSLIELEPDRETSFGEEVERGLTGPSKRIPCRFLYDERGSQLFEQICGTPEYYVTRAEHEILADRSEEIANIFPSPITLAELGSGSSSKTRLLIEALLRRHGGLRYLPVDISRTMLEASSLDLIDRYDALEIRAIASEYNAGLRHVGAETDRSKLIAWLGSNAGNYERADAAKLLGNVRSAMAPADRLLIGIDLRKDRETLEKAYDDAQGITAKFTVNLLDRINRDLGGHFDLEQFRHRAVYDEAEGRMEIGLVSLRHQRVVVDALDLEIDLAVGEFIHLEHAVKYSQSEIKELAASAGMRAERGWLDSRKRFSLNLFAPA
ncbi:MAG: L-histidine N(alpha)-methyltransferase [Myxococcota bacterium]